MTKINNIDQKIRKVNFKLYEVKQAYKFLMITIKRKQR